MQNGHTIQFDPGYDCGTASAGSRIGSLVIQRWVGLPLAGNPLGCTSAPVDLYPGFPPPPRKARRQADRNAKYWSKPMTINVTLNRDRPGATPPPDHSDSHQRRPQRPATDDLRDRRRAHRQRRPELGVRLFGDVAGTFTPTRQLS